MDQTDGPVSPPSYSQLIVEIGLLRDRIATLEAEVKAAEGWELNAAAVDAVRKHLASVGIRCAYVDDCAQVAAERIRQLELELAAQLGARGTPADSIAPDHVARARAVLLAIAEDGGPTTTAQDRIDACRALLGVS